MQFNAGVVLAPERYLESVNALCERFGVVIVVDEQRSAGGALGNVLACEGPTNLLSS